MHRLEHELVVQAPADNAYQLWRNFENFPNFMSNIEEVVETGANRSHWKARGPLGRHAEWDAEITRDEPARAIAWRSIDTDEDSVRTRGEVDFESLGDATRVHVVMEYEAPGGRLADWLTETFASPDAKVRDDMQRFKEALESNEGYTRATERIANVNTSEAEERAVEERYPANTYSPGEAGTPVSGGSTTNRPDADAGNYETEGRFPKNEYTGPPPAGPGLAAGASEKAHRGAQRREDVPGEGFPPNTTRPDTRAKGPGAGPSVERERLETAGTNPAYAEAKERAYRGGRQPEDDQTAYEAGEPEGMARNDRPITTSTPGGTLGAPTESELLEDHTAESDNHDTRYDTDER